MILRNPTLMSFLKNKMSPNGEILCNSMPEIKETLSLWNDMQMVES